MGWWRFNCFSRSNAVGYRFVLLTDEDCQPFEGEVLAVSDDGYAVGESADGSGSIWHQSFVGVRPFGEWLTTMHAHVGVTLFTWPRPLAHRERQLLVQLELVTADVCHERVNGMRFPHPDSWT